MKVTFHGYNAFVIESGNRKIAIDPASEPFEITVD